MSYLSAFHRSRPIKTGRLIAPIICLLPVLLLLLTVSLAGAQTLPLPTHAAGFYTAGWVRAVAVDVGGRFYIGGEFSSVNGVPRNNLARFNADGTLDAAWNPNPDGGVLVLAVAGSTVYVGGRFGSIGGQARNHLAALDATTGAATAWNPAPDGEVLALAVAGDTVYAGGGFIAIGGQARNRLAALDARTGVATAWNPNLDGYYVLALAVAGDTVYAGGGFTSIGGQTRNNITALDATTGAATAWNPNPDGYGVNALAVSGNTVYVAGDFTSIGGQTRNRLAALDAGTGTAAAWNPNPSDPVSVLVVVGNTVYVGGRFIAIGGQERNGLAALDTDTDAATAWNPNPDGYEVNALAVAGDTVYVGGYFITAIGGATHLGAAAIATTGEVATTPYDAQVPGTVNAVAVDSSGRAVVGGYFQQAGSLNRSNIARFNADGTLDTAWNPNPDGGVSDLAVAGDTVYVGGGFTTIGGQARNRLAALDATTGAATAWSPNPDYLNPDYGVSALAVSGDTVYVGGGFTAIGGQPRNYIAALDTTTGAATVWNPDANGGVGTLAVSGDTVYVGGSFGSIGGQARNGLAALDATTGAATAWNPNPDYSVSALAVAGDTVYVGGWTSCGGIGCKATVGHLKAFDADTGAAIAWNPNLIGFGVSALAVAGDTVYVGGSFGSIGGQGHNNIAALDATTGAATTWFPYPDGYRVSALAVAGNTVYAGGGFTQISGVPRAGFAALPADGTPSPTITVLASNANPASFGQAITFTATVTGQSPTGTVAFEADGNPLTDCTAVALNGGAARCVASGLSVGSHAIGAAYGGDAGNRPSNAAPLTQTVRNAFAGPSPSGQGDVGADFSGGGENCHLTQAALVDPPAAPPAGYGFPHGLLRFALGPGCTDTVTVRVTYPAALPAGATFWKYGRTAAEPTPHWYRLTTATLAGASATFTLTDGGLGDDDLAANGSIADDGGIGVPITEIPTLSEWTTLLLLSLLLGYGGWRLRQSRSL